MLPTNWRHAFKKHGEVFPSTVVAGPRWVKNGQGQKFDAEKVKFDDGDLQEMTVSEVNHWHMPAISIPTEDTQASLGSGHGPLGDHAEDFHEEDRKKPSRDEGKGTWLTIHQSKSSERLSQSASSCLSGSWVSAATRMTSTS